MTYEEKVQALTSEWGMSQDEAAIFLEDMGEDFDDSNDPDGEWL